MCYLILVGVLLQGFSTLAEIYMVLWNIVYVYFWFNFSIFKNLLETLLLKLLTETSPFSQKYPISMI